MGGVRGVFRAWAAAGFLVLAGCSDPVALEGCDQEFAIALSAGGCISFTDSGLLSVHREMILQVIESTYDEVRALIGVDGVEIQVFAGTLGVIPEISMGGFAWDNRLRIVLDSDSPVLAASIATELRPLLAHELHHVARHRALGFSTNLLEQIVNEGLADHFSIEVTGSPPPPWAVALEGQELSQWTVEASRTWLEPTSNFDAWLFGTTATIPRWTGYSIGFDLVGKYLEANVGSRPSSLVSERAESFAPAG